MIAVNVLRGGDDMANALIYKPLSQATMDYLGNHLSNTLSSIRNVSDRFVSTVRNMYDRFNGQEAINRAKMALYSAGIHFNQDMIYPVRYENYRDMNLMMQRYVMSQPDVSELYRKNKCYGFSDTFIDPEPNTYGEDRFDYQRVMDGVVQFRTGENGEAFIKHYSNSDDQDKLSILDKLSVIETWDTVSRLIADGLDPTDPNLNEI